MTIDRTAAAAALTLFLLALGLALAPSARAGGCTINFDGGEGGNPGRAWEEPTHWDLDRLPTIGDRVCIASGLDVEIASNVFVDSILCLGRLTILGGQVVVQQPSTINLFELQEGRIGGSTFEILSEMTWSAGDVTDFLRIEPSATLEVVDGNPLEGRVLDGTIDNHGTVMIDGTQPITTLNGTGRIFNRSGALLVVSGEVDLPIVDTFGDFFYGGTAGVPSILELLVSGEAELARDLAIGRLETFPGGSVTGQAGRTYELEDGGVAAGTTIDLSGATVRFEAAANRLPPRFTVSGELLAGSVVMNAVDPLLIPVLDLKLSGSATFDNFDHLRGEVTGAGTLTVDQIFDLTFGVHSGGGATIAGGVTTLRQATLRDRYLLNFGTMQFIDQVRMGPQSVIENDTESTIEFAEGGGIATDVNPVLVGTLFNGGLLRKSGPDLVTADVQFEHTGTLEVLAGNLYFPFGGKLDGDGTVATGATLTLEGIVELGGSLGGDGTLELIGGVAEIGEGGLIDTTAFTGQTRVDQFELVFDIGAAGQSDRLDAGIFSLIGTSSHAIFVLPAENFQPLLGARYELIGASSGILSQPFGFTDLPSLPAGLGWSTSVTTDAGGQAVYAIEIVDDSAADLSVELTSDATPPTIIGESVTYTAVVENFGPDTALDVALRTTFSLPVDVVSADVGGGSCTLPGAPGGPVVCQLGDRPIGATAIATIVVTPQQKGTLTARAVAASVTNDPAAGNESAELALEIDGFPTADLSLALTMLGTPQVGATTTLLATVTNDGPDDAIFVLLNNIYLGSNYVVTGVRSSLDPCQSSTQCVTSILPVGATWQVEIDLRWVDPGNFRVDSTVASTDIDPTSPNAAVYTTFVNRPPGADLDVDVIVVTPAVEVGTDALIAVDVTNRGFAAATDTAVLLALAGNPGSITAAAPTVGSCTLGAPTVCNLGTLGSGQTVTIDLTTTAPVDGRQTLAAVGSTTEQDLVAFNDLDSGTVRFDTAVAFRSSALVGSASWNAPGEPGMLYAVDASDGTLDAIGDVLVSGGVEGLAADDQGRLWGVSTGDGFAASELIRIDPADGSVLQTIGFTLEGGTPRRLVDLAFDPVGRRMLATGGTSSFGGDLYALDLADGSLQFVAFLFGDPDPSIAFTGDGRLFATSSFSGQLQERDPTNGFFVSESSVSAGFRGLVGVGDELLAAGAPGTIATIEPTSAVETPLTPGPSDALGDLERVGTFVAIAGAPGTRGVADTVTWGGVAGATDYDVYYGTLAALSSSGGDFAVATSGCLAEDTTATSVDLSSLTPAAGSGFWFVVAANAGTEPLTGDVGGVGLWASRDGEAAAAVGGCVR